MHALLSYYTPTIAAESLKRQRRKLEHWRRQRGGVWALGDSVCRLLYQPPVALFTDINGLMTKYSSLCPKLSKYLDTQLPSVDVCNRERNRQDKGRTVVSWAFDFTHTDTLLQGIKVQGIYMFTCSKFPGKMQCFMILSFIRTYTEYGGLDGRKIGFCGASAGSNQTFSVQQPLSLLCSSPTEILALNSGMEAELFWPRGLSSPISPSFYGARLKARKLLRDYGYPFSLFIFIRDLYPHKRDQMKCLPAFSTDSLRSSSPVWALFVGVGVFFFFYPNTPKSTW